MRFVYGNNESLVVLYGTTGDIMLDSNLGEPSRHSDYGSVSAELIDLGIVDTGKRVSRQLRMFNSGSLDIIIANVITLNFLISFILNIKNK